MEMTLELGLGMRVLRERRRRAFRQREEQVNSSVRGAGGAQCVELHTRVGGRR